MGVRSGVIIASRSEVESSVVYVCESALVTASFQERQRHCSFLSCRVCVCARVCARVHDAGVCGCASVHVRLCVCVGARLHYSPDAFLRASINRV